MATREFVRRHRERRPKRHPTSRGRANAARESGRRRIAPAVEPRGGSTEAPTNARRFARTCIADPVRPPLRHLATLKRSSTRPITVAGTCIPITTVAIRIPAPAVARAAQTPGGLRPQTADHGLPACGGASAAALTCPNSDGGQGSTSRRSSDENNKEHGATPAVHRVRSCHAGHSSTLEQPDDEGRRSNQSPEMSPQ
jgi:hypothetical protein